MNLYLDTSALVKLYIQEVFSDKVRASVEQANVVSTQLIAYVEAHATFARLYREKHLSASQYDKVKMIFEDDWLSFLRIECDMALLKRAGELALLYSLRAYDSVHLASAEFLKKQSKGPLIFACFDKHLTKSAHALGLGGYQ